MGNNTHQDDSHVLKIIKLSEAFPGKLGGEVLLA